MGTPQTRTADGAPTKWGRNNRPIGMVRTPHPRHRVLTIAEKKLVAEQIGRLPRSAVAVAARCPAGHPCVITNYPLRSVRGQQGQPDRVAPFPTLYWLTCPQLCRQVAHLERDGLIAKLEAEMAHDDSLRAAVWKDHERYIAQRLALLSAEDHQRVESLGLTRDFTWRGIGGIANRAKLKCLHLHLAHHLATGNAIGALLVERHGVQVCPSRDA